MFNSSCMSHQTEKGFPHPGSMVYNAMVNGIYCFYAMFMAENLPMTHFCMCYVGFGRSYHVGHGHHYI